MCHFQGENNPLIIEQLLDYGQALVYRSNNIELTCISHLPNQDIFKFSP